MHAKTLEFSSTSIWVRLFVIWGYQAGINCGRKNQAIFNCYFSVKYYILMIPGIIVINIVEKMVVSNEDTNDRIMVDDGISSACTVALLEISALIRQVDSSVAPLFVEANGIRETVFECVTHPSNMCRLAAAWCLRCIIRSVPTQATPLIKLCFSRLKNDRKTPLAIAGFSTALAALTAGSLQTELGIPFQKTHDVFDIAEEMIRTAPERIKLALR
jgi:hypothetical protein